MKKNKKVDFCVKNYLCTGCGICKDICPEQAISIQSINNINVPVIDKTKCCSCSICYNMCTGKGFNLFEKSKSLFDYTHEDGYYNETLKYYYKCWTGHSNDYNIRFHAAAGGLVTTFLIYLLEKDLIGGAVVTGYKKNNPFEVESFFAATKDQIIDAMSSKYCPVAMDGLIPIIKEHNFPVAVVGLPCHIHAFRNSVMYDSDLRKKIYIYIGLFCSGVKDYRATKFLCKKHNIEIKNVSRFAFRDEGCLGYLKVVYKDGRSIKIPYLAAYNPMNMFFRPERCASCIDHFGLLADVSFGDIYMPPYNEDTIGTNAVVCRSKMTADLLEQSALSSYIKLNSVDASEIVRSGGIWANRLKIFTAHKFIDKLLWREGVVYDNSNEKLSLNAIKFDIKYRLQRIMGKTFIGISIFQWLSFLYRKIKGST